MSPPSHGFSFTDPQGLRHSVNVQAGSLYEAVTLAASAFREGFSLMNSFAVSKPRLRR
jgi:hypothetical protein